MTDVVRDACADELYINVQDAPEVRRILKEQSDLERVGQGRGDTELMLLCCVKLFALGQPEDILRIWDAKESSGDADFAIDIQLMCGRGLEVTLRFLENTASETAKKALVRIQEYIDGGFFIGFTPDEYMSHWVSYFCDDDT